MVARDPSLGVIEHPVVEMAFTQPAKPAVISRSSSSASIRLSTAAAKFPPSMGRNSWRTAFETLWT